MLKNSNALGITVISCSPVCDISVIMLKIKKTVSALTLQEADKVAQGQGGEKKHVHFGGKEADRNSDSEQW